MKKFTILVVMVVLSVGCLQAQQWSDVGDPGFTTSNQTLTNPQFAYQMAMFNSIPYMAYITSAGDIVVMKYSAGTWALLPAPSTGSASLIQLAFDAAGNLYLGYSSSSTAFVKKFNGTAWSTVGTGGIIQDNINGMAINPVSQEPYIAVYDGGGTSKATVLRFNGTSWVTVGPAQFSSATQSLRLAISSAGVPYLTLQDGVSGTTFSVQKFDGTNWVAVGPAGVGNLGGFVRTDITIDASGTPYVYSSNPANGKASVLKFNGTAWVTVGLADFSAGGTGQPFFKFDNSGVLHLAYMDVASANGANKATVMKFNGTAWVAVGNAGLSGAGVFFPSLAFDSSNQPFIGFRDASTTGSKGTVMKLCASHSATVSSTIPGTLCGSGTITLSATSTGTLRWYSAATNGAYVGTGTSFTTPSLTNTTSTYSVAAYDGNGCSSPRTVVTAIAKPVPSVTATVQGSACVGNPANVSAMVSAGTASWYTTPTGGSPFASGILSGATATTPAITATTTFYVEAVNNGCASASRTAVQVTAVPRPANPVAVNGVRCGPGSVSISVTSVPGTVQWFTASTGGTLLQASGNTFVTPSISTTTFYYADVTVGGCVSTGRTAVQAFVSTIPVITSSTAANRCGDGSVTLSVATSGDASAQWFTAPTGGTAISTLKTFVTPSLTTTTTYYAEAIENGCPSTTRTAVVATIKPIPTVTSANVSRCDAGTVTFEASSNGSISWFAAATGGIALGTGPNFTTPSISVTTPYFIEAVLNGCTTPGRTSVSAIVNSTPPQPVITQNNSNIEAPVLTSSASSGNQWFKNDVILPGENGASHTITSAGLYKVQVSLNGCPSPFSENVTYVVTGMEDLSRITRLYPNPVTDVLVIDLAGFKRGEIVTISVVDFLGRYLRQEQGNGGDELYVDVKPFNPGQYHLVLTQGKTRITKSFIRKF